MPATMKELGIDQWPVAERLALLEGIWESIAASPEGLPLTEEQQRELDRRLADLDATPQNVLTWEQIRPTPRR